MSSLNEEDEELLDDEESESAIFFFFSSFRLSRAADVSAGLNCQSEPGCDVIARGGAAGRGRVHRSAAKNYNY